MKTTQIPKLLSSGISGLARERTRTKKAGPSTPLKNAALRMTGKGGEGKADHSRNRLQFGRGTDAAPLRPVQIHGRRRAAVARA
jgi:hypothetical protein